MANVDMQQALAGLRSVENRILERAAARNLRGFKIEWNDGLDFGHLMDPVPVALVTEGGLVDGRFSLHDLTQFQSGEPQPVTAEIDRMVTQLAAGPHDGPPKHEPPGAP